MNLKTILSIFPGEEQTILKTVLTLGLLGELVTLNKAGNGLQLPYILSTGGPLHCSGRK